MIEKTRAIVLRSIKYGESQLIIDFFTESHGRLSFLTRLPKSGKGKVKRQYFQPLMLLNIEFDYRPQKDLQRLSDIGLSVPLMGIPFSPLKISLSLFLAEFLYYATRAEQHNQALFEFLYHSVLWLDGASGSIANFHIVFLIRLTLFLGVAPNVEIIGRGRYFDLKEGCYVDKVPLHTYYLSATDSERLLGLLRLRYQTMNLYPMSRSERNHCVEVIVDYYRLHVPGFPEMKSLPILKGLFD